MLPREPIAFVAAVERVGERPIPGVVAGHVGIEQIDRHRRAAIPFHDRAPRAHVHASPFDHDLG
jgi:hypothetical protein